MSKQGKSPKGPPAGIDAAAVREAAAREIAARFSTLDPDLLIDSAAVAAVTGYTMPWVLLARRTGKGPPFVRLSIRRVRYRVRDVREWLDARAGYTSTSEYNDGPAAGN